MYSFAIDPDLRDGLRQVKERDGVAESEQIRRAVRVWLEQRDAIKPPGKVYGPTSRASRRGQYFRTRREAQTYLDDHPGSTMRQAGKQWVVIAGAFQPRTTRTR